jgi:hypothetical protein
VNPQRKKLEAILTGGAQHLLKHREASFRLTAYLSIFALLLSFIAAINFQKPASAAPVTNAPWAPEITSVETSAGEITINFDEAEANGQTISGYRVEYALATSNNPSWTLASDSISATARSYKITGLTSGGEYFVRIAAKYSTSSLGAWGYPWKKIYEVVSPNRKADKSIQYAAGYGLGANDEAAKNADTDFSRIRYVMSFTSNTVSRFVAADFSRSLTATTAVSRSFSSLSDLQVPTKGDSSVEFIVHADIADLNVMSDFPGLSGKDLTGRLEIWPMNYDTPASSLGVGRDGFPTEKYDDSDTPNLSGSASSGEYGSFQLHSVSPSTDQTIFAWNRHANGEEAEVGFGDNPNESDSGQHSDWTFVEALSGYVAPTNFNLGIFVNSTINASPQISSQDSASSQLGKEKILLGLSFKDGKTKLSKRQQERVDALRASLTNTSAVTCRSFVSVAEPRSSQIAQAARLSNRVCSRLKNLLGERVSFDWQTPPNATSLKNANQRPLRVHILEGNWGPSR